MLELRETWRPRIRLNPFRYEDSRLIVRGGSAANKIVIGKLAANNNENRAKIVSGFLTEHI